MDIFCRVYACFCMHVICNLLIEFNDKQIIINQIKRRIARSAVAKANTIAMYIEWEKETHLPTIDCQ